MLIDSDLFLDVADALGMGNPAIVEKDYYVVALLKLLSEFLLIRTCCFFWRYRINKVGH